MQVNYKYSINSFFTVNLTCNFYGENARTETGYGYFGARYYSSELGIWISTDPLADERPSYTPYNFCRNNPIVLTDPSGLLDDEYEINKKGEISKVNDNKHYVERDGKQVEIDKLTNNKGESIDVTAGVLGVDQKSEIYESYTGFSNETEAENFYYFTAESSNVEWTIAKTKYSTHVGTDHNEGHTRMPHRYEKAYKYSITFMSHSHPVTGGPPSGKIRGKNGDFGGDLWNADQSNFNYQREAYSVPDRTIYGYDRETYERGRPYDYIHKKY
jgi:RHS repeat-associated protein